MNNELLRFVPKGLRPRDRHWLIGYFTTAREVHKVADLTRQTALSVFKETVHHVRKELPAFPLTYHTGGTLDAFLDAYN